VTLVRRSGRRPGNQDTRRSILDAAREVFADKGFDGASIRAIAGEAKVDPALVHHYFGTKDKLFLASMNMPLVRLVLSVWDSPAGTAAVALFRSAMSNEWTARLLREFVVTQVLRRAIRELGLPGEEAGLRSALVASQIAGLAVTRYVLKIEPVASADPETLVRAIGPNVQRYLTGEL
jgi:AcrR family transcriptional regulator